MLPMMSPVEHGYALKARQKVLDTNAALTDAATLLFPGSGRVARAIIVLLRPYLVGAHPTAIFLFEFRVPPTNVG